MIKAGLDIGHSKISCVVADYKDVNNVEILSLMSIPNSHIKKNIILNYNSLIEQIKNLINETEKNSQTKINSLNLNLSLLNSSSHYYDSEIKINNEKISELHLKKIVNQSDYFDISNDDFELINNIISYDIDNINYDTAPIGNYSDKIKIYFYKLLVKKKYVENFTSLVNKLKLNIENYIPSCLSSSLSTITSDEKKLGTICIDLGHSITSIAIFENNKFIFGDSIGVGSNNVTLDIARGVSTSISSAERLKTLYGSLLSSPSDEHEIIEIPVMSGEKNSFNQITISTLNSIIKPRIEETLEMIWQKVKDNNFMNKKIKNIVITGGGSQLNNLEKYVEMIFAANSRVAKPLDKFNLNKDYNKPGFSDVIGSIAYNPNLYEIDFLKKSEKNKKNLGISTFFSWLDQYI